MKKFLFAQVITVLFLASCGNLYNDGLDSMGREIIFNLRDIGPAGGLVFYDKGYYSDGWRYMEVTQFDQDITTWSDVSSQIGTTGTIIGTGLGNTYLITHQSGHTTTNYAAKLCEDFVFNGYSDWFLPSWDELNKMYINLTKGIDENGISYTHVGNLDGRIYWSSSEKDAGNAKSMDFTNGSQSDWPKNGSRSVRATRRF